MKLDYLKQTSIQLAGHMALIDSERLHATRQINCATFLHYAVERGTLEMYLNQANFCNQRSCPVCQWRRSVKLRLKLFTGIRQLLSDRSDLVGIFLTLTVKNCHQSDLRWTLRAMESGWAALRHRADFPALGYLKSVEVSRPHDCYYGGQYLGRLGSKRIKEINGLEGFKKALWQEFFCEQVHPHFHVLMLVDKSYFSPTSYIDHLGWVTRWRMAMRLDYSPVVDIRRIYSEPGAGIDSAIFEASKYMIKPSDLSDALAPFVLRQFYGLKLVSTGGILSSYLRNSEVDEILRTGQSGDEFYQFGVPLHFLWNEQVGAYEMVKLGRSRWRLSEGF